LGAVSFENLRHAGLPPFSKPQRQREIIVGIAVNGSSI